MSIEAAYQDLLRRILERGDPRMDRTGVGTRALFGETLRCDLGRETPILTTKRVSWKTAVREMLWFLSGDTNIRPLLAQNVHIWSEWPHKAYVESTGDRIDIEAFEKRILEDEAFAARHGDLGPVYGRQWRRWKGPDGRTYDQIAAVIDQLQTNPSSRRILFHGWNVPDLGAMALPPCHLLYQYQVTSAGRLNGIVYQRSVDTFLGLPFNLVGAAALQLMLAQQAALEPGELVWMGGDVHLYDNHHNAAREQIARESRPLPIMRLNRRATSIDEYRIEDFEVEGYAPHPAIHAAVAI